MRAIQVKEFGGPEVLAPASVPEPEAGPGEVVVANAFAPVLFLDTSLRSGWGRDYFPLELPYVPGGAVAGQVAAVGPDVDASLVGARVTANTQGVTGGYAERARTTAAGLIRVPDGLDLATAAALHQDARTALRIRETVPLGAGSRVLVNAAAGALGLLLVQSLTADGVQVVGAARGPRKLAAVRSAGAAETVDYGAPGWAAAVGPVDAVLDGAGGAEGVEAFGVVRDGGTFFAYGAAAGGFAALDAAEAERRRIATPTIARVQLTPEQLRRLGDEAIEQAVAGRLQPVVGATYPLERAADAHAALTDRAVVGKVLLTL